MNDPINNMKSVPDSSNSIIKTENNGLTMYSAISASLSSFLFGVCLLVVSPISQISENWNEFSEGIFKDGIKLSPTQISSLSSVIALGALFTTLTVGYINISVKQKIILNNFLFFLGNLLVVSMHSYYVLLIGRIITGFAVGITCTTVPSYLNEISSVNRRGFIGSFHSFGIVTGVLAGAILTYFFEAVDYYKYPLYIVISFIIGHTFMLLFIKNIDKRNDSELNHVSIIKIFSERKAYKSIITASLLHLGQQLSAINGVVYFSSTILQEYSNPKFINILVTLISVVSTIFSMVVIDRFGRKFLIITSSLICALALGIIGFTDYKTVALCLYMGGFNIGLGPVTWLITGEVFPTAYLKAGNTISVSINWLSNFGVSFLFVPLIDKLGNLSYMLYIISLLLLATYFYIWFKETKGKPVNFQ